MNDSPAPETYRSSGLKGVAELYQEFPLRLRERIVNAHARLWCELWGELSEVEQSKVGEYVITEEPSFPEEIDTYEAKLRELDELYPQRHSQRVKEALQCPPTEAVEDIQSFERAHSRLTTITQELLPQARTRKEENTLREQEALQFCSS